MLKASFGAASGLAVRGEVDLAAVPALEQALEAEIKTTSGPLMIDLSEVGFLDSSGLLALLHARGLLVREDRALVIVCPEGQVRHLFEVAGVAELLILCASRAEAEASVRDR